MALHIHKKFSKRKTIQNSDPGKILDLVMHLTEDTCALLQVKINSYLIEECDAETTFQIVVFVERMEAFIETVGETDLPRKMKICMFTKLNEVLKSTVEVTDHIGNFPLDFQEIIVPFLEKKDLNKKRVVMYPIIDEPFSLIVCAVAPKIMEETVGALVHECFLFTWPTIKKCIALEYECTSKKKCQQLLRVARRLFSQVASLETLLQIVMEQAKQLTRAEHCLVMLVDMEKMELVSQPDQARRFPMDVGICGIVMSTGMPVNVKDVKDHPEFNPTIDGLPNVTTKSLLCFPIRECTGIIGVGLLINKIRDPYFDLMDEELALAFSIYCGVCITHSVVYKKIKEAHVRNAIATELVMYHMKISEKEVERMMNCTGFHGHPHVTSLHFNPRALPLRELPCYVMRMFTDLGFVKNFQIRTNKLTRFILYVRKGYRNVPYHSWHHSFNVAQWAYAAMVNYKLVAKGYMTELQGFMYLVAAMMHDLDHRGTTNSFQIQGQTSLAALYSSEGSVMERHHLAQAMSILNTEGCDILESLSRPDYDRAIMMLKDFILATDLANYCQNINNYREIARDFQLGNRLHRAALHALLMNAADLSDQLKEWGSVKKTAVAVLTEFFKQGDVEKSRGDLPSLMMDREKCFIPELEIQFLNMICVPLYKMLEIMIPAATTCTKIIENHIERWTACKPIFAEVPVAAGLSILLSPELDGLIESNLAEMERQRLEDIATAAAEAEAAEAALAAEAQKDAKPSKK